MNVIVNGLMTNYHKTGKGKTLLFLAGWGDDSRTFAPLFERLKAKYQLVAVDLPGFGGTQPPSGAWSLTNYADFVKQFINKADIKPYAIIGHSYGGAVAVVLTAQSAVTDNLILLASAGIRDKRPVRKKILAGGAKIGKAGLLFLPAKKRKTVKSRIYNSLGSDITAVPGMEKTFRTIISQDVRETARQVSAKTLLIYGSQDDVTPVSDGHILNRSIKGSRLEAIGAGHFLHREKPEQVAVLIDNFLKPDV